MDLLIKSRTGITIDNMPPGIFQVLTNYQIVHDGVIITCNQDFLTNVTTQLFDFYSRVLHVNTPETNRVNNLSVVTDATGLRVMDLVPVTNAQGRIIDAPVMMRAAPPPTPPIPPAETRRIDAINELAQPVDANEDDEDVGVIKPSHIQLTRQCEEGKEKLLIAKSMRNGLASTTQVINEKITCLNQLMARTIILQNELSVLMAPIVDNPKIIFIIDQINELNKSVAADSIIKKAYVDVDGNMTILTNRVFTELLEDDTVRDIGELELMISSTAVLSESATTVNNPIVIKNLTHYLSTEDGDWACGHVRQNGSICFGNVFPQVHRALSDKNIVLAVELIVKFIRNPNIEDAWGKNILGFPIRGGQN